MLESESNALPLGDTPLKYNRLHWLGWQDSDLRMRKSKSRALPLGDTPLKFSGVSKESRTLDLQGHNLALYPTELYPPRAIHVGAPEGIRTPDPRLRRALLYPAELLAHIVERVMGIGPTQPAWKAGTLPLSYTRIYTPHMPKNNNILFAACQQF